MKEKLAMIISFLAGAMVAKNWSRIKKCVPFCTDYAEGLNFSVEKAGRVAEKEEKGATIVLRKKAKRRRLTRRKQLIKERQPSLRRVPKPKRGRPSLRAGAQAQAGRPRQKGRSLPLFTRSRIQQSVSKASSKPAPEAAGGEFKPRSSFWSQLINKIGKK